MLGSYLQELKPCSPPTEGCRGLHGRLDETNVWLNGLGNLLVYVCLCACMCVRVCVCVRVHAFARVSVELSMHACERENRIRSFRPQLEKV